jgi:hypothetical protein
VGVGSLFVGITSLLGGWRYWHGDRYVLISTVPADAEVGLYYIRFNFQKRFERARTPVRVRLPKRANTTGRDVFFVRVVANGFTTEERSYPARKVSGELLIQLAPLPNDLVFFGHTYLAGRTTLLLHTSEEPQFRVSQSRASPGFVLALAKTADKLERRPEVSAGQVQGVDVAQLGEDILISIATRDTEVEVRSKQSYNPIREEYILLLDIMSRGARVPVRDGLDPVAVAKAFRPTGGIADVYRREAMLHLGRLDRGTVHTLVGEDLRTGNPIELQLALQTPVTVEGYLGLLEVFALSQDEPSSVLRSLLAPEMSPEEFRPIAAAAEAARKACRN